jgi:hypothetical protein
MVAIVIARTLARDLEFRDGRGCSEGLAVDWIEEW